ncbi:MAG: glutamate synthase [Planctomycetes bacterium]|nr:glutamate synthase [Planctomycetota bacterium]
MAELIPAPFGDLVARLYREPAVQDSLFELPRRSWYCPPAAGPDLGVRFQGHPAGNPSGPAAGPHTQMAQNLLLSYVAGARILELKTVQVDDRLTIPRPCIDMTNVGYNVEWSQELRVDESLREYAAGAMLIEMFRRSPEAADQNLLGPAGDVIYDISVGYDLAGIRSDKVRRFLDGMRDAGRLIEQLRQDMPSEFAAARDHEYATCLSTTATLSTFHGCPADEIESICHVLIGQHDLDVIVKMNPPTLGRERLEHLLYDVMGYTALRVNPKAYDAAITLDESIELSDRLMRFAESRGRRVGFKFSNTLEVTNHREFFTSDNEIMYLSGQPLYVITMALTDVFRRRVGPSVPITFSAGVDKFNFPDAVACGFVPITTCTDLLRPGGYGRLPAYLYRLAADMDKLGAGTIDEYVLRRFGQQDEAGRRALTDLGHDAQPGDLQAATVNWAGLLNTAIAAERAKTDPRYRADRNGKIPKRIDSQLETFDCITCDKCLPVCPNAANFKYPTPLVSFDYHDIIVSPNGQWRSGPRRHFEITERMQIACYADFCNECGNCDTFCPEYGGPYIQKPSFFGNLESWKRAAPRDGFVINRQTGGAWIRGRIKGAICELKFNSHDRACRYSDGAVEGMFSADGRKIFSLKLLQRLTSDHVIDLGVYHTLHHLYNGVLDRTRINQVNAWATSTSETP